LPRYGTKKKKRGGDGKIDIQGWLVYFENHSVTTIFTICIEAPDEKVIQLKTRKSQLRLYTIGVHRFAEISLSIFYPMELK
jgi:hypothetical protein